MKVEMAAVITSRGALAFRSRIRSEPQLLAASAFLFANLLHMLDHLRQGLGGLSGPVLAGGALVTLSAVAALALAWRQDPHAPVAAVVIGSWDAILVAQAHMLPSWGAFSNSYPEISADVLSWAVMLGEVAAASALAVTGAVVWRRQTALPVSARRNTAGEGP
jgi:hypothetical protein